MLIYLEIILGGIFTIIVIALLRPIAKLLGALLRQLGLCPAGTVHLSRRSAGVGGQRPHDPCKPAAHCGESGFSGVVSSAGKSRPCVVRLSAAPVAAHRRRRFCPWHGKPDAPRLCSAGKSRAQGRGTGRRT